MIQSVVINLGKGSLSKGFTDISAQVIKSDNSLSAQFTGSLRQTSTVAQFYQVWQSIYYAFSQRMVMLSAPVEEDDDDDELEIDTAGVTQVSQLSFEQACQDLTDEFNGWLKDPEFLQLEQKLRSRLSPSATIRIIIETDDELVKRLPWHCWSFLKDYPNSEIALSRPEYQQLHSQLVTRQQVRILAILGNSQDIDVAGEQRAIAAIADAETKFLICPSRREFDRQLWDSQGWDILFFAGHSRTEGQTGRIYINEEPHHNSLTIEQLEEALKTAIARGLKLAIFNSCDGLGLANALEKLNIPQVIVMRLPVPNLVAEQFFHYFLEAFAVESQPLYLAVKQARCRLQGLEAEYPAASWLPVICQNPAVRSPNWLDLGGIPPCPYRGLYAFQESDADLFFGREEFVANLRQRVEQNSFVAVVGASGSGKSSVVFAGLVPQLRQSGRTAWQIVSFRPGSKPMSAMAAAFYEAGLIGKGGETQFRQGATALTQWLDHALDESGRINELQQELNGSTNITTTAAPPQTAFHQRRLLIVDQFEELYTLASTSQRQACLANLITAVEQAPAFTLVITLRADFYGEALAERRWSDLLQGAVYNLSAMNRRELHQAIALPAQQMQVKLESGLSTKLMDAVDQRSGRLPLLEFTLTQLWSQQQNGWLTHAAYEKIGGVESALANHAEAVYARFDRKDRARIPKILIQLVQLGEGGEATRRIATKDEVRPENWDLVGYLADQRLVMTNLNPITEQQTVEIVHEALIQGWGRLGQWLKTDRDFRLWQQRLRRAIAAWENSGGDRGALLRGKPLADAQYWQRRQEDLSSRERDFIARSIRLQQQEHRQQRRRRKFTIAGLMVGLAIAISLSGVAGWQWQNSAVNEILATSKYAKLLCASAQGFDGLMESLRAANQLERTAWAANNSEVRHSTIAALQETVYGVRERNRIDVGEEMRSISFSPDGSLFAAGTIDGKLLIWHADGSLQKTVDTGQAINEVAFSPDGRLATAGDNGIQLWQTNGKLVKTLAAGKSQFGLSFSPNGQTIATVGDDGTIKLWNLDGIQQSIETGSATVFDLGYSPDGKTIATAGDDGTIKLWTIQGELVQTIAGYQRAVISVAFSPDGQILAASSEDGTIKFWRVADGTLIHQLSEQNVVHQIAFTPDGRSIITVGGDTTIKIWNTDYSLRRTFIGHTGGVLGLALSPNSQTIASASADGTIKLWQLDSQLFKALELHDDDVYAAAFSPDNQTIATTSGDRTIKLWNRDGTLLKTLAGHTDIVHSVNFSPDGNLIATASWDKTVKLWRLDGTLINTLTGHSDRVYMADFSPDGRMIASSSSDGTIKLWRTDGTLIKTLTGHQDVVHGVAFSPDGQTLASASHDRTIKLWTAGGKLLQTLTGHSNWVHSVAFSPDGQTIASASHDRTVKLWGLDGKLRHTVVGHTDKVLGVAFSPDGQTLASASRDGSIKLWQLDGTSMATLRGHGDWVHAINFSPDGYSLASASYDNTAIVWDLKDINNLDVLIQRGCSWIENYLQANPDAPNICPITLTAGS